MQIYWDSSCQGEFIKAQSQSSQKCLFTRGGRDYWPFVPYLSRQDCQVPPQRQSRKWDGSTLDKHPQTKSGNWNADLENRFGIRGHWFKIKAIILWLRPLPKGLHVTLVSLRTLTAVEIFGIWPCERALRKACQKIFPLGCGPAYTLF